MSSNKSKQSSIKNAILEADDLQKVEVDVSEWWSGIGSVYVSEMSADARDEFEQYLAEVSRQQRDQNKQYAHIRGPLCAMCIVDADGERAFEFEDMEKLGKKNARALDRVFEEANKLNKVFGQEREDIEKNSETTTEENNGGESQSA